MTSIATTGAAFVAAIEEAGKQEMTADERFGLSAGIQHWQLQIQDAYDEMRKKTARVAEKQPEGKP